MNPRLALLHPYPFERLRTLLAGVAPPPGLTHIPLSIGEPKHAPPAFVGDVADARARRDSGNYPLALGLPALRATIAGWLERRFGLPQGAVRPDDMVLPVNGTREALFAFVQAAVDDSQRGPGRPLVLMPNPFYQIYEGAALLAGAEPYFMNCTAANGYLPDLDAVPESRLEPLPGPVPVHARQSHRRRHAERLPAPGARTVGATRFPDRVGRVLLRDLPRRACAAARVAAGRARDGQRVLRALRRVPQPVEALERAGPALGFRRRRSAGARRVPPVSHVSRLRGAPSIVQRASIPAWSDETHVVENRRLYREKFARVVPMLADVLDVETPAGAFYLWPQVDDDEAFTRGLFAQQNVTVRAGLATWRATRWTATRDATVSASRWSPASTTASKRLVASSRSCLAAALHARSRAGRASPRCDAPTNQASALSLTRSSQRNRRT